MILTVSNSVVYSPVMSNETAGTQRWTLTELAQQSGCPARTIRYYIARGLIPPPHKAGPGAHYGPEHLERLRQIRAWQARGLTLAEIGLRLGEPGPDRPAALEPVGCWAFAVAPDVTVYVRADVAPWRARQIRRALEELAGRLASNPQQKEASHANHI